MVIRDPCDDGTVLGLDYDSGYRNPCVLENHV